MKYKFDGFNWIVRLKKDDLLVESLIDVTKKEDIQGAWIMGLGAASWAELGFYDLNKQKYQYKEFNRLLEITSLQGNIGWQDSQPAIHVHGSFSDEDMNAFGGHIKEIKVAGTIELLLHRWYSQKIQRKFDNETGLNLLDL